VGRTALGVALVRAEESRRPDQLFDDQYAEAFVAAAPGVFDAEQRAAATGAEDMASWGRPSRRTPSRGSGSSTTTCSAPRPAGSGRSCC
jgi:O-methyltransferase involved in polyketide biosynthesis